MVCLEKIQPAEASNVAQTINKSARLCCVITYLNNKKEDKRMVGWECHSYTYFP